MSTLLQTITSVLAAWTLDGHDGRVVKTARDHVRAFLAGHPAADDAVTIVSELVTNAHLHSRSGQERGFIGVGVSVVDDAVAVIVSDQGPIEADEFDRVDHGRGLTICMLLAHVTIEDDEDGRTVTARILPTTPTPDGTE